MKKILSRIILPFVALSCTIASCDDWTDLEPKINENLIESNKTAEYYEQLRAYKASDHPISFGWFGNWSGKGGSLANCMVGLPDSVDVISMWGGWKNPTEDMLKDLRVVQQQRGTKALVCFIILEMGDQITPTEYAGSREGRHEYWGWVDDDEEAIRASIVRYANAICDTIDKYNYDGFDLDWEPSYAQPFETNKEMAKNGRIALLIETMSKRIGPASGTGRIFAIDGEPEHSEIPAAMGKYFDYFISQAYAATNESGLNNRLNKVIQHYRGELTAEECAAKFIVCENFESYAQTGGVSFSTPSGKVVRSVEGMARWNPTINGQKVRKGGVGTFHMEYEFTVSGQDGTYPFLRNAIRIMNPPVQ